MPRQIDNVLIDLLRQVKEVLDEHNAEFWLECGTLLGAVRDGKFIPWEHDIDFGAWRDKVPETTKSSVAEALRKRGFKVWIAENHMNIKKESKVHGDINFYHLIGDSAVKPTLFPKNLPGKFLCAWLPVLSDPYHPRNVNSIRSSAGRFVMKNLTRISRAIPAFLRRRLDKALSLLYKKIGSRDISWIVPSKFFSKLDTMKFYDMEFKVPDKTEEYLAYRYGKDWRIPKKDWITERDDGAVAG